MNNPRIAKLLKGCGGILPKSLINFIGEEKEYLFNCPDKEFGLCDKCKAELLGILGQMKCEVEFLEKRKKEFLIFNTKQNWDNTDFFIRLEELNSDIKRIEEMLK